MNDQTVSQQIRSRRRALGLSLAELARLVGTSPATLSRYENGWERFEVYTLQKIAAALRCRLSVRLQPRDPPPPRSASPASARRRVRRLFWDRPLRRRDFEQHTGWVVKRVLEHGSLPDVRALIGLLGRRRALEVIAGLTFESDKTESFWQQILEKEGIPCTRKYSREEARNCWPGWRSQTPRS